MNTLRHQQRGVGLIEILVAVLLISIGFLATARMQMAGMQYSQSAYYQSQAYFMASEMIDRMRANSVGVNDGFYDDATTSDEATDPNCDTRACRPSGIALQDISDWSEMLYGPAGVDDFNPILPSTPSAPASGTITRLAKGRYLITMRWSEVVDGSDQLQELPVRFSIEE
ncbi:MAG: type IV pilus modification protein PilV [Gammaproteobacteria bacterium]|nr:MAG: type IV pilus modification protein PilV [Gammaproteobacteria bacterium]PIE34409.1 MAG: type IV pilus modification protein PilV [Gammaproteobacteria bacterium]